MKHKKHKLLSSSSYLRRWFPESSWELLWQTTMGAIKERHWKVLLRYALFLDLLLQYSAFWRPSHLTKNSSLSSRGYSFSREQESCLLEAVSSLAACLSLHQTLLLPSITSSATSLVSRWLLCSQASLWKYTLRLQRLIPSQTFHLWVVCQRKIWFIRSVKEWLWATDSFSVAASSSQFSSLLRGPS